MERLLITTTCAEIRDTTDLKYGVTIGYFANGYPANALTVAADGYIRTKERIVNRIYHFNIYDKGK